MSMVGGNLEQLDGLQRSFVGESANVASLLARINAVVHGTTWLGPAADAFRGQWDAQFAPALGNLRNGLDEQARVVASRRAAIAAATS
jgi:uncharacterized protein YukE